MVVEEIVPVPNVKLAASKSFTKVFPPIVVVALFMLRKLVEFPIKVFEVLPIAGTV